MIGITTVTYSSRFNMVSSRMNGCGGGGGIEFLWLLEFNVFQGFFFPVLFSWLSLFLLLDLVVRDVFVILMILIFGDNGLFSNCIRYDTSICIIQHQYNQNNYDDIINKSNMAFFGFMINLIIIQYVSDILDSRVRACSRIVIHTVE